MTYSAALPELTAIATNDRATPSLVYRSLLRGIKDGLMVPGAKLPNERELAQQLKTSRTVVRSALAMMERQGLPKPAGPFSHEESSKAGCCSSRP